MVTLTKPQSVNVAVEGGSPKKQHPFRPASSSVAAMLIFLLAQFPLQCVESRLLSLEASNYSFVRDSIRTEAVKSSILCLGDSLVKLGVSPLVLEKLLSVPVFNLAVIGSRPMATYYILKRVLDAGGKPRCILVDFEPGILYADPRAAVHESAEFYDAGNCFDAGVTTGDWNYAGSLLFAALVPCYRLKYALSELVEGLWDRSKGIHRGTIKNYLRNWQVNRGQSLESVRGDPVPSDPVAAKNVVQGWRSVLKQRSPWMCNKISAIYITKFFDLAQSHGIYVYWLITPMHQAAQAEMESLGVDASYVAFVKQFQQRFPNLVVVDGRHANCDGNWFIDAAHFHRRGSVAYSAALAKLLSSVSNQQWIPLPSPKVTESSLALEDVDQSSKAIRRK